MSDIRIGDPELEEKLFAVMSKRDPDSSAALVAALSGAAKRGTALWVVGEQRGDEVEFTVTEGSAGQLWCCFTGEGHIRDFSQKVNCYALPASEIFRLALEDGIDGIVFNPDRGKGIMVAAELIRGTDPRIERRV